MPVMGGEAQMRTDRLVVQKLKMVSQGEGIIMVPLGGIPTIFSSERCDLIEDWMKDICTVLNFLQCGCPEVVIYSSAFRLVDFADCNLTTFQKQLNHVLDGRNARLVLVCDIGPANSPVPGRR